MMPRDFPDLESLKEMASLYKFRKIYPGEKEYSYRLALALHVRPHDLVESYEIQFGIGWDKWSIHQKKEAIGIL